MISSSCMMTRGMATGARTGVALIAAAVALGTTSQTPAPQPVQDAAIDALQSEGAAK